MNKVVSLNDSLDSKLDKLHNTDEDWVTFIKDHINTIKASATTLTISDADRDRYVHKFDHYLRENQCNQNIIWIAKLINDVLEYENFTLRQTILLPNRNAIVNLYRSYRTSRNLKVN